MVDRRIMGANFNEQADAAPAGHTRGKRATFVCHCTLPIQRTSRVFLQAQSRLVSVQLSATWACLAASECLASVWHCRLCRIRARLTRPCARGRPIAVRFCWNSVTIQRRAAKRVRHHFLLARPPRLPAQPVAVGFKVPPAVAENSRRRLCPHALCLVTAETAEAMVYVAQPAAHGAARSWEP